MNHSIKPVITASLALLATQTFAQDAIPRPNYTYIEADVVYGEIELESSAETINFYLTEGAAVRGSWNPMDQLLVRGSYYTGSGEYKNTRDVDWDSWLVSVGWLPDTTDSTGIDLSLDYRDDSVDLKGVTDESVDGIGVSAGVRTAPFKNTEFGVRLGWYEGDYDGAIGFTVNAAYNFGERWGVNLYWDQVNDVETSLDQYGIGGRFYF